MAAALDLDFVSRRRSSLPGWALFLVGLAAASLVFATVSQIRDRTSVQQAAVERIEQALPQVDGRPLSAHESRTQEVSLAAARRIENQLNLPWSALFSTLEKLAADDIALLTLAPDARKQQVRLSAEARTLEAMLRFHRRLEESTGLSDVALVSHEIVENTPGRPVRFHLTARWAVEHANP